MRAAQLPLRALLTGLAGVLAVGALLPGASGAVTDYNAGNPEGATDITQSATFEEAIIPGPTVTAASWVHYPGNGYPAGYSDATITSTFGMPDGAFFAILTTGDAAKTSPPSSAGTSNFDSFRGANDVIVLRVDIDVPAEHNCVSFEVQFLSDEYPDYVGQDTWNDNFIAELDVDDWEVVGNTVNAPNNFAFTPTNQPITVSTVPMSPEMASGSGYGGASQKYTAKTTLDGGPHSVYFSIFDKGDSSFDSAVFIDNLRTGTAAEGNCDAGITFPNPLADFTYTNSPSCGPPDTPFLVMFDASSTEPGSPGGGAIVSYAWSFGGPGGSATGVAPSYTYSGPGTYMVSLTVTDSNGKTNTITQPVDVPPACPPPPPNEPPTATIDVVVQTSCQDSSITFTATVDDPERDGITYFWTLSNGYTTTDEAFTRIITPAGNYWARLTVVDTAGNAFTTPNVPFVSAGNPNCCPTIDPFIELGGVEGTFFRALTHGADFEGDPLTYSMQGGPEGAELSGAGLFTWQTEKGMEGDYDATITLTDGICTVTSTIVIRVVPPPPPPTPADADLDGLDDISDNCPSVANHHQTDADGDRIGDACDPESTVPLRDEAVARPPLPPGTPDADVDRVADAADNCPAIANADQGDFDRDGEGDACDRDLDGDRVLQVGTIGLLLDNCPITPNPGQDDADGDGLGDACDAAGTPVARSAAADASAPARDADTDLATRLLLVFGPIAAIGAVTGLVLVLRRRSR